MDETISDEPAIESSVGTILWNSQTWIISKAFKENLKKIKEKADKLKSHWMWVDIVSKDNPRLFTWMGRSLDDPNVKTLLSEDTGGVPA